MAIADHRGALGEITSLAFGIAFPEWLPSAADRAKWQPAFDLECTRQHCVVACARSPTPANETRRGSNHVGGFILAHASPE
ncbi:hypothetical protein FOZ63_031234 [Perkinsus olseni]|uniref:Uncharacterized protein n=1 Tax=Perkinsus olseni TaxID=32597 RepID=A0A7J6TEA4_PEROL|nr:hypothetical protein FOZ63_031234 [Perkinsus olseni]